MKKYFVFSLLTLIFIVSGCHPHKKHFNKVHRADAGLNHKIYEEAISRVIYDHATEMKYVKTLRFEDSRICYGDKVNKIRLDFSCQRLLELCEARELLVYCTEGFLEKLNNNLEVAGMLGPYPFTADQLEININMTSFYGIYLDPSYIGWIRLFDGVSYFYAFDNKQKSRDEWHKRSEFYYKSVMFTQLEQESEERYREEVSTPDIHKRNQVFYDTSL